MDQKDWYQQALTPPEVLELRIRLGVIPSTDHVQCLVELLDPVTSVLVAQASVPHAKMGAWAELLDWARLKGIQWLDEAVEPF